jgi:hypothetical protein
MASGPAGTERVVQLAPSSVVVISSGPISSPKAPPPENASWGTVVSLMPRAGTGTGRQPPPGSRSVSIPGLSRFAEREKSAVSSPAAWVIVRTCPGNGT